MEKRHQARTCAPGRDLKRGGLHRWNLALGREQVEPQSGHPSPGVLHRGDSPLGCWENCWDREKGWRSLDSTFKQRTQVVLPTAMAREPCTGGSTFLDSLIRTGRTLLPCPLHTHVVQDLGHLGAGKRLGQATQRAPGSLGCDFGGVAAAMVSVHPDGTPGARGGSPSRRANTPHCSLVQDLGQASPGRRLSLAAQRRPRGTGV